MRHLKSLLCAGIASAACLTFAASAFAQVGNNAPTNGAVGDAAHVSAGRDSDLAQDQIKSYNAFTGGEKYVEISAEAQVAQMGAGINWGGYDGYLEGQPSKFKLSYFYKMKEAGFKTVRIPLFTFGKGHLHMDVQGHLDPAYFKRLDTLVEGALRAKLNVILDEHDFDDCAADTDACAAILPNVWYELSEHYKNAPNTVMFELLNEPHGKIDDKIWNAWLPDLISIVRETNPTRNIIVGPIGWNSIDSLATLQLPEKDRHLIVTFHYYSPMEFTHQGASWVPQFEKMTGVRWTGTPDQMAKLNGDFDKAAAWGKAHNRPMFLGEYGTYGKVNPNMADRVAWTKAVSKAADDRGFARAYWYFADGDGFGAFDLDKAQWVDPIKDALTK